MPKPVPNSGAALFEGKGSAYHPTHAPAVEECASNPFGSNVHNEIAEAVQTWLSAGQESRYTVGALHTLREALTQHAEEDVKRVITETFVRSDFLEIRRGLNAAGLLKASKKSSGKKQTLAESQTQPTEDAGDQLLREAVVFLPPSEEPLRNQIESYLGQR